MHRKLHSRQSLLMFPGLGSLAVLGGVGNGVARGIARFGEAELEGDHGGDGFVFVFLPLVLGDQGVEPTRAAQTGGVPPLYLITHQRVSICDLMICTAPHRSALDFCFFAPCFMCFYMLWGTFLFPF